MTHSEFFKALKGGQVAPAYLFAGEEEHIKESALAALRQALLPEGLEAMNETILNNPPADDIIAAAETLPMLAERRLVLVRDSALLVGKAAGEGDDATRLAAYLERLPDTACIVFYCRGNPDKRKKLCQALAKHATVVAFDRLGDAELHKWMQQQLRAQGKRVAPDVAAYLAFMAGRELLTLAQELSKLAAFAGAREEITRADIDTIITPSLESTVFQMVDAIVAGKEAEAFRLLGAMLENGEARIGILAMMARQYRNLLHLRLMQDDRQPDAEIQRRLGVPPFAVRRLKEQVRGASVEGLRAKLDLCVDTDYDIKRGKMREDAALERAILRLCSKA